MSKHLPKLPPIDAPTQALFDAIKARDEAAVHQALENGARLDQAQPYRASRDAGSDVEGGGLPLQAACSTYPQKPLQLGIVQALLAHGADANAVGDPANGDTPLSTLCQALPQNGANAVRLLVQHGAQVHIGLVQQALCAHQAWVDWKGPVQYLQGTLDALWDAMPAPEKAKLSVEMLMRVVPDVSAPLDYEQLKRVQWLSTHCQEGMAPTLAGKLHERREAAAATPARPGVKLH